jgi:hypothetical protein
MSGGHARVALAAQAATGVAAGRAGHTVLSGRAGDGLAARAPQAS